MTLLAFEACYDHAFVATDTLVVTENDGTGDPMSFASKMVVLPHLHMVMACVGVGNVMQPWGEMLSFAAARNIFDVDAIAPAALRSVWRNLDAALGGQLAGQRTTVFHIGGARGRGYTAFSYCSEDDWSSNHFNDNYFWMRPPPAGGLVAAPASRKQWAGLAKRVHREQMQSLQQHGRGVHVGGELIGVELSKGSMTIDTWHRFNNYDEDWRAIRTRSFGAARLAADDELRRAFEAIRPVAFANWAMGDRPSLDGLEEVITGLARVAKHLDRTHETEFDTRLAGQRETAHSLLDAARQFTAEDWQAGRASFMKIRPFFEHLTE